MSDNRLTFILQARNIVSKKTEINIEDKINLMQFRQPITTQIEHQKHYHKYQEFALQFAWSALQIPQL